VQQFLTSDVAADRLGVSVATLRRWVRDGRIRALRTPGGQFRFDPVDIDDAYTEDGVA